MKWNELFGINQMPRLEDIKAYIGPTQTYWDELVTHLEEVYQPQQQLDYSKDSLQPGWNVKFRKSGKALCTLYPMPSYFIVLVVIGPKDETEVKKSMDSGFFTPYVKELYDKTTYSPLGRWLMIDVKNQTVLQDIIKLIQIRTKANR
jgi:hypothetical protein